MSVNSIVIKSKIAFIGEAPGETEERTGIPFSGASGKELRAMLEEVGIYLSQHFIGNVVRTRPPDNDITKFFCSAKDHPNATKEPPIAKAKFLHPDFHTDLAKLRLELTQVKPNIIVALGNTAFWALTGKFGINAARGKLYDTKFGKVLPTFHPTAVLRQWSSRPIVIADFFKVLNESKFPEILRSERNILVAPTLAELYEFEQTFLTRSVHRSFDIETSHGQISCIAICAEPSHVLCIPFAADNGSYWTADEEVRVWEFVRRVICGRDIIPVTQNGLFDIQYLARQGVFVKIAPEDTMLFHHALFPEMRKSLDFLASIYTNAPPWKHLSKEAKDI